DDAGGAGGVLSAVGGADDTPRGQRLGAPLQRDRLDVLELDYLEREPARPWSDQDLHRPRRLLQPGGEVDGLAGRERRVGRVDDDLAGLDADPRLQLELLH